MASFDKMLARLHEGGKELKDAEQYIEINNKRQFIVPPEFDTTIAYEGDVNSQIITFMCPISWENHDLSKCAHKKILWVNKASGVEGINTLSSELYTKESIDANGQVTETNLQLLKWTVPPEVFAQSGTIELSISLYDLDGGSLAFAWNTATFSQLQVGSTMQEVGLTDVNTQATGRRSPARNEILTIDLDHRNILVPSGYNYMIANYGEVGMATVHFQVNRYYKNFDVSEAKIKIYVSLAENLHQYTIYTNSEQRYFVFAEGSNGDGTIQFDWIVPPEITCNAALYTGPFSIGVVFEWNPKQLLRISEFSGLKIGGSVLGDVNPFPSAASSYHIKGYGYSLSGAADVAGIVSLRDYVDQELTPVKLKASANTFVANDNSLDKGHDGSSYQLRIKNANDSTQREAYIKFDTTQLNFNYGISKIILKLYCKFITPDLSQREVHDYVLYSSDPEWDVNTFTWTTKPDLIEPILSIDTISINKNSYFELDVTEYIQDHMGEVISFAICNNGDITDENDINLGCAEYNGQEPYLEFIPEDSECILAKNELVAEYDKDGKYIGLKIGTIEGDIGGQLFAEAPYVFSTELFNQTIENYLTDKNRRFTISAEKYTGKETS